MKRKLKSAIFFCMYYSGIEWLLAKLVPVRAAAILMYHGVCDTALMPEHINFHVSEKVFARQMQVLKRRYRVAPLSEIVEILTKREAIRKSVVLTFDDGYRNNATNAAPILFSLGLPASIFVATKYVENQECLPLNRVYWAWSTKRITADDMTRLRNEVRTRPADEADTIVGFLPSDLSSAPPEVQESFAMLTWEQIQTLKCQQIEFGSHTHSHCNMAVEDEQHQQEELSVSKELLERHLENPIANFAYPYGKKDQMSASARTNIVNAGFRCAITGEYGLVTQTSDPFSLNRLGYDERIWMFAGEIVYQLSKQWLKDGFSLRRQKDNAEARSSGRNVAKGMAN